VQDEDVVVEDEYQHRREERVQISEELPTLRIMRHVSDRIEMDQRAHAGEEQYKEDGQRVEPESEIDLQCADRHPGEHGLLCESLARVESEKSDEHDDAADEGGDRRGTSEQMSPAVAATPEEQQNERAGQGQCRYRPQRRV